MAFKDTISGKFLCPASLRSQETCDFFAPLYLFWWKFIYKKECIEDYLQGLDFLKRSNYTIIAMVGDRGLSKAISPLPYRFCQFYAKIKLTNNHKTQAWMNLLKIANSIFYTNSTEFKELFENFHREFEDFLNEKSINDKGKSFYAHKRLRSAYFSLKRNLPLLFTYEKFSVVPNTNNKLEGGFADLKSKLKIHRGLNLANKEKFISWYFWLKNR